MDQGDSNNSNYLPVLSISKGSDAIHYKPDPKSEITLGAAKSFNALSYLMQSLARRNGLTPAAFNQQLGNSAVELHSPIHEFMKLIGCNSKNYEYLEKLVQETGKMRAVWSNGANNNTLESGFMNLFTMGRIHKGMVHFVIPPETRNLMLADRPVAVIEFLSLHHRIASKYGMALNDLIEEAMFDSDAPFKTIMFEDQVLRNGLKIKETMKDGKVKVSYPYPTDLQRKVLGVAVPDYNNAGMKYQITNHSYQKVLGNVIWSFTVISREESQKRLVATQYSDDIMLINSELADFKMDEDLRSQYITSISDEYELQYLLYCIQLTKNPPTPVSKPAGYFNSCYKQNREKFAKIWEVRKIEKDREKAELVAKNQAHILEQKESFKKQFIRAVGNSYAESYQANRKLEPDFLDAFKEHCSKMGRSLKADQILKALNSGEEFDYTSPLFLGFCATWVTEKMPKELADFVNSQTISLPTAHF